MMSIIPSYCTISILFSETSDVVSYRFLLHRLFLTVAEFVGETKSEELGESLPWVLYI